MSLVQIVGLIIVFGISIVFIFKHKKDIEKDGKYLFHAAIIFWAFLLFVIISNSGILKTQLPEETGSGVKYTSKFEEKVEKQNAPKLKNDDRDYKKEGEEALKNSLK